MEERPIDVVRDSTADGVAEREKEDLGNDPESRSEDDVADRPAVVEGANNEDELGDYVDDDAGEVEDEFEDEESRRAGGGETGGILEGTNGDETDNETDDSGGTLQKLRRGRVSPAGGQ
jgi:hypothetical protein